MPAEWKRNPKSDRWTFRDGKWEAEVRRTPKGWAWAIGRRQRVGARFPFFICGGGRSPSPEAAKHHAMADLRQKIADHVLAWRVGRMVREALQVAPAPVPVSATLIPGVVRPTVVSLTVNGVDVLRRKEPPDAP